MNQHKAKCDYCLRMEYDVKPCALREAPCKPWMVGEYPTMISASCRRKLRGLVKIVEDA